MDASENLLKKTQCKGSNVSQRKWKFYFSSRRWTNKIHWRRSGTENTHLDTGAPNSRRKLKGFSWRIRRVSSTTSFPDAGEAINDFWSMSGNFICRNHVEPRVKLCSPREESFPILLKCIDVTRTTDTCKDVMLEKNIDDNWNVDGDRELSDTWTGFTRFTILNEKPPDGHTWSGVRLTRKQMSFRPDTLWPEVSDASKRKEKAKVGNRETKARQCQIAWHLLH